MTIGEQQTLKVALDFLREWRDEDKEWKREAVRRLEALETRNTAADAVKESVSRRREGREKVRNLVIGAGLSGGGMIVAAIINNLPK